MWRPRVFSVHHCAVCRRRSGRMGGNSDHRFGTCGLVPTSLSVVSEARVSKLHTRARCVCALSIQRLEGSRPRFAADAGPMQIQWWEGAASSCAEAVRRRTADDTTRSEAEYCGKILRRECVRKPEEEICLAIRRRAT